MFNRDALDVLISKVPDLKTPWKLLLTVLYVFALGIVCAAFFYLVDRLAPAAALISQTVMALIVVLISHLHFTLADDYRQRYGPLAYRHYFYHLMIPYLVTWYACFFHPLFVSGPLWVGDPALLPAWLAAALGVIFLLLFVLSSVHIERAGFHVMTHGLDLYTVFPEEATVVYGDIYSYIRHPLCFSLTCGSLALGFFRNTDLALLVALLQLIPVLYTATREDQELIRRVGDAHKAYIAQTAMLVPVRRLFGFLRFVFFLGA